MRVLPWRASGYGVNHTLQEGSVRAITYRTNRIALVESLVVSVGLDSDLPVLEATSPHFRKTTAINRTFSGDLHIRWFQPITLRWEGWPKCRKD